MQAQDYLQRLQNEFQLVLETQKIRLGALQDKRADVLIELHDSLSELRGSMAWFQELAHIRQASELDRKVAEIVEKYRVANDLFLSKRFYVSESLADQIKDTMKIVNEPIALYVTNHHSGSSENQEVVEGIRKLDLPRM